MKAKLRQSLCNLNLCIFFQLLDMFELTDKTFNRGFMLETQSGITGGFAKWPDHTPG